MAPVNMFKAHVTQQEIDLTLTEEHSAWRELTRHHPSPPPEGVQSTEQDADSRDQLQVAIQYQQSHWPYLEPRKLKKYATKRSAVYESERRRALKRVELLSLRRDSGQENAAYPSIETIKEDVSLPNLAEDQEASDGQRLEFWRKRASTYLLQSIYAKLGVGEGWKQYSPTTLLACRQLQDIISKGDPLLGLQVDPSFHQHLKSFNWWFVHATDAQDFLRYLIFSDTKFGSSNVRIDVVKHLDAKGACTEPQHKLSQMAWVDYNLSPPDQPCGCVQYKTLLKWMAAESSPPEEEPWEHRTLVKMELYLRKQWQEANEGAPFLVLKEWPTGEQNKAAQLKFQEERVLKFKFWRRALENGGEVKGLRVEGRLEEMV